MVTQKSAIIPNSKFGKAMLGLCVTEALIIIAFEIIVAYIVLPQLQPLIDSGFSSAKGVPVYLMIFLFSQFYAIYLCWDGVIGQNTIQVLFYLIFNFCVIGYSAFQYNQLLDLDKAASLQTSLPLKPFLAVIPSVATFAEVCYLYLSYMLYKEFGWKVYKKIGADPKMKSMYRAYQIFLAFIKLDVFFFLAFCIQYLVLVLIVSDPEFSLTIIAIVVSFVILIFAVIGLQKESRIGMGFFLLGLLTAAAYFIFKIVRIWDPTQASKYKDTPALSLLAVVLTFINAVVCILNFDQGLKQHIDTAKKQMADDRKMSLVDA